MCDECNMMLSLDQKIPNDSFTLIHSCGEQGDRVGGEIRLPKRIHA